MQNFLFMILLAISTGIIVSLIPNLTQSVVKKDSVDVNNKVNQALSILIFFTLPMTLGISLLAPAIWNLFYGVSEFGANILSFYIFVGFMIGLFTATITIVQVLKDYKTVIISLFVGVIVKILLNTNLMIAFYKMGLPAYYGVIAASLIGYFISFIICIVSLKVKYHIRYEMFVRNFIDVVCGTMLMFIILYLLQFVIPISSDNRLLNLVILIIYGSVGALIYFIYSHKFKVFDRVFGRKFSLFKRK